MNFANFHATMKSMNQTRIANLRRLIEKHDGPANLARLVGYANSSFIVQMAGPHPDRNISEMTARKIEERLDLPPGWLDRPDEPDIVKSVLEQTAAVVEASGHNMTPTKLAELTWLVYEDAVKHGQLRDDYIKQLMQLLRQT